MLLNSVLLPLLYSEIRILKKAAYFNYSSAVNILKTSRHRSYYICFGPPSSIDMPLSQPSANKIQMSARLCRRLHLAEYVPGYVRASAP